MSINFGRKVEVRELPHDRPAYEFEEPLTVAKLKELVMSNPDTKDQPDKPAREWWIVSGGDGFTDEAFECEDESRGKGDSIRVIEYAAYEALRIERDSLDYWLREYNKYNETMGRKDVIQTLIAERDRLRAERDELDRQLEMQKANCNECIGWKESHNIRAENENLRAELAELNQSYTRVNLLAGKLTKELEDNEWKAEALLREEIDRLKRELAEARADFEDARETIVAERKYVETLRAEIEELKSK